MPYYKLDNRPAPINFQTTDILQRTLQNAKNLIMCRMGEVPYDRLRGFDHSLYDKPIDEFRASLLPELDRVMMWDPDVTVVDAEATLQDDGSIYIVVTVEININLGIITPEEAKVYG